MADFESLPDEAQLSIFSGITDAKTVSRMASLCSKWRELTRHIESLTFDLSQEREVDAIPGMLRRAYRMKHLVINVQSEIPLEIDQVYAWIELVKDSLETLELCIPGTKNWESGKDIWKHLEKCSKLSVFRIHGRMGMFFPLLQTEMTSLREIVLDKTGFPFPAVQYIMKNCTQLERLVVTNFPTVKAKLSSNSLRDIHLKAGLDPLLIVPEGEEPGCPFILLEAANLRHLILDGVSCVLCAPELVELHLPSRCKDLIVVSLDNAEVLTMGGDTWEFSEIHSVVELVPKIRKLRIDVSVVDPQPVVWKTFFQGLNNLKSITLGGNMLECFCKEVDGDVLSELKIVEATVYLSEGITCADLLNALLERCSELRFLYANCSRVVQRHQGDDGRTHMELFEEQQPELFSELEKLQVRYPRLVTLRF